MPGSCVYVIEVRGDLLVWYDAVGGEGANGWIAPPAKEAKPVIRVC